MVNEPQDGLDVEFDRVYDAGARVNFPALGLSLEIPSEWVGTLPADSAAFIFGSHTRAGLVLAVPHDASSTGELVSHLSQPIPLDEGVVLHARGQPRVDGPWVELPAMASQGNTDTLGFVKAMAREGAVGVIFIGIGPEPGDYYRGLLGRLADSVREYEPAEAAGPAPATGGGQSPSAVDWSRRFRGMRLTYMSSYDSGGPLGGGTSTRYEYDLCSDGRFAYLNSSSISGGHFAAFGDGGDLGSSGSGQWRIVAQGNQAVLELRWSNGEVSGYTLETDGEATYLDGERWFVTPDNASCA